MSPGTIDQRPVDLVPAAWPVRELRQLSYRLRRPGAEYRNRAQARQDNSVRKSHDYHFGAPPRNVTLKA